MLEHGHITEDGLYAFALGYGETQERAQWSAHLRACRECTRALAETQMALSALSLALPEESPAARSEQRFLAKLEQERRQDSIPVTSTTPRRRIASWRIPFAITALAACALLVLVLQLSSQNRKLADVNHVLSDQARSLLAERAESAQAVSLLSSLTAPDTAKFVLTEATAKPEPQVRAFYRKSTGQVLMTASTMPAAPHGKAYELWLLTAEKPIPAGVFQPDAGGSVALIAKTLPAGLAVKGFGVTMEDQKGSETPTLPILMASK